MPYVTNSDKLSGVNAVHAPIPKPSHVPVMQELKVYTDTVIMDLARLSASSLPVKQSHQ